MGTKWAFHFRFLSMHIKEDLFWTINITALLKKVQLYFLILRQNNLTEKLFRPFHTARKLCVASGQCRSFQHCERVVKEFRPGRSTSSHWFTWWHWFTCLLHSDLSIGSLSTGKQCLYKACVAMWHTFSYQSWQHTGKITSSASCSASAEKRRFGGRLQGPWGTFIYWQPCIKTRGFEWTPKQLLLHIAPHLQPLGTGNHPERLQQALCALNCVALTMLNVNQRGTTI